MDFDLSEEQKMIQETIRKFAKEEIAPVAGENDKKGQFPRDIFKKLAELGFMGTPIPEEYGGAGFDYISHAIVAEEIGRVDSSLRGTYSVQVSLVELPIFKFGTEGQKKKYLPKLTSGQWIGCYGLTEPNAGSDPAIITSLMVKRHGLPTPVLLIWPLSMLKQTKKQELGVLPALSWREDLKAFPPKIFMIS